MRAACLLQRARPKEEGGEKLAFLGSLVKWAGRRPYLSRIRGTLLLLKDRTEGGEIRASSFPDLFLSPSAPLHVRKTGAPVGERKSRLLLVQEGKGVDPVPTVTVARSPAHFFSFLLSSSSSLFFFDVHPKNFELLTLAFARWRSWRRRRPVTAAAAVAAAASPLPLSSHRGFGSGGDFSAADSARRIPRSRKWTAEEIEGGTKKGVCFLLFLRLLLLLLQRGQQRERGNESCWKRGGDVVRSRKLRLLLLVVRTCVHEKGGGGDGSVSVCEREWRRARGQVCASFLRQTPSHPVEAAATVLRGGGGGRAASVYQQRRPPPPARMREKAPPSANSLLGWPSPQPPVLAERKKNSLFPSLRRPPDSSLSRAEAARRPALRA